MLDSGIEARLADVVEASRLEQLLQVTSAGAGELGLVGGRRIELADGVPERPEGTFATGVVPDTGNDHAALAGDPCHLAQAGDRIGHEVHHQLSQRRVEGAVVERKGIGRCLADVDARVPLARRLDEWRGRIDGGDGRRADPCHELGGERTGPASDVQHSLACLGIAQVGHLRREVARVSAHESVVRVRGDVEAHRRTLRP